MEVYKLNGSSSLEAQRFKSIESIKEEHAAPTPISPYGGFAWIPRTLIIIRVEGLHTKAVEKPFLKHVCMKNATPVWDARR